MISVTVERAPADRQGPDISDALICTEAVAIERGRNEIDAQCSNRETVQTTAPYRGYVRPGALIEVDDADGGSWRGMVTGCQINIARDGDTGFAATNTLTIEREPVS